jgi:general secretion pathway protein H
MAAMQTVEYGLRCEQGGFRFVMYDARKNQWLADPLDEALRPRMLPAGIDTALSIEDRPIVLPPSTANAKPNAAIDLTPQVMLFSSGDLTSFKLTLARTAAGRSALLTGTSAGKLEVGPIVEQPT